MGFFGGKKNSVKRQNQQNDKFFRKSPVKKVNRTERLASHGGGKRSYGGLIFLWLVLFGTTLYILFFSPQLALSSVEFSGAQNRSLESAKDLVKKELSGKYFGVLPRNNFFVVRPLRLKRLLESEYPLFRSVEVSRHFPNRLSIHTETREIIVLFCSGGPCHLLDEEGKARESVQALKEENLSSVLWVTDLSGRLVDSGEKLFDPRFPSFVTLLQGAFQERFGLSLENRFTVTSRFASELRAKTAEDFEIFFSTELPLESSLKALSLLFEKELPEEKRKKLRYIDLRAENRIYYVFDDGAEQKAEPEVKETEKKEEKKKSKKN